MTIYKLQLKYAKLPEIQPKFIIFCLWLASFLIPYMIIDILLQPLELAILESSRSLLICIPMSAAYISIGYIGLKLGRFFVPKAKKFMYNNMISIRNYQYEIGDDYLIFRYGDEDEWCLHKDEIKHIKKLPSSLLILTEQKYRFLEITKLIEDFDDLEEKLSAWFPMQKSSRWIYVKYIWPLLIAFLIQFAGMVIGFSNTFYPLAFIPDTYWAITIASVLFIIAYEIVRRVEDTPQLPGKFLKGIFAFSSFFLLIMRLYMTSIESLIQYYKMQ